MLGYKIGDRIEVTRHDEPDDPPVGWRGTVLNTDMSSIPLRVDWTPTGWAGEGWWLTVDQVRLLSSGQAATQEELALTHGKWHLMGMVRP